MPLWFFSLPSLRLTLACRDPRDDAAPLRLSPVNLPSAAHRGRVPVPSAGSPGTDGAAGDVKPVGVFWAARCQRH